MTLNIIILAAGQGKRMQSAQPKVLHALAGKPLLHHVVTAAETLNPATIYVVYGHGGDKVQNQCNYLPVQWVEQKQQLGTGHAVAQAMPLINNEGQVLVLVGDIPLITATTLQRLMQSCNTGVGLVTVNLANPNGYGRILRNANGQVIAVVEDKDANPQQKQIQEINTGIIAAPVSCLKRWLPLLKNQNAQGEYLLPDIMSMAVAENIPITAVTADSPYEVQGVNDRIQLAMLERYQQRQIANKLMLAGVTLMDPDRIDVRGELHAASDVIIDVNVIIEGNVSIGKNSIIGPNTLLRDVNIGENVTIKANSIIEEAEIANGCIIGPFARIRPGTKLDQNVHIGNFVEVKKSNIGEKTKINHLSYVGDASVGREVNIGAGTITCNYDGKNKYQTIIEDRVFIGSDTQLVAPITIGHDAIIGAGSTLTQDAPADATTITQKLDQRTLQKKEKEC